MSRDVWPRTGTRDLDAEVRAGVAALRLQYAGRTDRAQSFKAFLLKRIADEGVAGHAALDELRRAAAAAMIPAVE